MKKFEILQELKMWHRDTKCTDAVGKTTDAHRFAWYRVTTNLQFVEMKYLWITIKWSTRYDYIYFRS